MGRGELGADGTPRRRPGDIKTSERKCEIRSVRRDVLRYKKVRKKREGRSVRRDVLRYKKVRKKRKGRSERRETF